MKRNVWTGMFMLFIFLTLIGVVGWNVSLFWQQQVSSSTLSLYWTVYILLSFSYLIAFFLQKSSLTILATLFKKMGSYSMGVLFYVLLLLPLADSAYWIMKFMNVRESLALATVGYSTIVILAIIVTYGLINARQTRIKNYTISIDKAAGRYEQLNVLIASDLHLGTIMGKGLIRKLVRIADEWKPDLVLLPGDVLDDRIEPFIEKNMAVEMKKLYAPLGVYAVVGNHEFYGNAIEKYKQQMEQMGHHLLLDEVSLVADSFYIAGRLDKAADSFLGGRKTVEQLLEGVNHERPILLLDHQPHHLEVAAQAGADVMLSGHTHAGQFWPNRFFTRRIFELDWGYMQKQAMHVIVSCGFGAWGPPLRVGTHSEVIQLQIHFRKA